MWKNPGELAEIGTEIGTEAATKNAEAASSTIPYLLNFNHTGNGLTLGTIVILNLFFFFKLDFLRRYVNVYHKTIPTYNFAAVNKAVLIFCNATWSGLNKYIYVNKLKVKFFGYMNVCN